MRRLGTIPTQEGDLRVDIRVHDIDCTDALRQHVERRLRFALGRLVHAVTGDSAEDPAVSAG